MLTHGSIKLSVLFKRVRGPRVSGLAAISPENTVPFPLEASEHVQNFRFNLPIVPADSSKARNTRRSIAAQFGALASIGTLQDLALRIDVSASPMLQEPERSLPVIRSNVRAIASRAQHIPFNVTIAGSLVDDEKDEQADDYAALLNVVEHIFDALQGVTIAQLSLEGFFDGIMPQVQFDHEPAYAAFSRLAPTIKELHLSGPGWLPWCPNPIQIPSLRTLKLRVAVDFDELEENILHTTLPAFINAAACRLANLDLDFPCWTLELLQEEANPPARQMLRCPSLVRLKLSAYALGHIFPHIDTLPCQHLDVEVRYTYDWQMLRELLCRKHAAFPDLVTLHLRWAPCTSQWEDVGESKIYGEIRDFALQRHIALSIHAGSANFGAIAVGELCEWLPCVSEHLVAFETQLIGSSYLETRRVGASTRLRFPALRRMVIRVDEDLKTGHATPRYTLAELLSRVDAPKITLLSLDIWSPSIDYLSIIEEALTNRAWPNVRAITGSYTIPESCTGWSEPAAVFRKKNFQAVCAELGVSLVNLIWAWE